MDNIIFTMPEDLHAMMAEKLRQEIDQQSLDKDLWGTSEIATFLGKARITVQQNITNRKRNPSFPEHVKKPFIGRKWLKTEVMAWAMKRR